MFWGGEAAAVVGCSSLLMVRGALACRPPSLHSSAPSLWVWGDASAAFPTWRAAPAAFLLPLWRFRGLGQASLDLEACIPRGRGAHRPWPSQMGCAASVEAKRVLPGCRVRANGLGHP